MKPQPVFPILRNLSAHLPDGRAVQPPPVDPPPATVDPDDPLTAHVRLMIQVRSEE